MNEVSFLGTMSFIYKQSLCFYNRIQPLFFQDSSGDDYVPNGESEDAEDDDDDRDDDSDTSEIIHIVPNISIFAKNNSANSSKSNSTAPCATIPTTNNKGERKYDKRYYCMYCQKSFAKLPRHLRKTHKDEQYVIEYLEAKSKREKKKILERIRNIGNHLHNRQVLLNGNGELFVKYRPTNPGISCDEFSPCPNCFGYFRRKDLWRHKCQFKPEGKPAMRISVASKLLLPNQTGSSDQLHRVLSGMRSDSISRIVKSDAMIRLFGEKLCNKHAHDIDQHNYIRQKLRELGRLVEDLRIKDDSPDKFLGDYIDPSYYRMVVTACRSIAGFDNMFNKYGTPSLALKLGHSLGKCAKLMLGQAIEHQNKAQQDKADEFMKLLQMNWADDVSSNAIRTLNEAKKNSEKIVPLAQDVGALMNYLKSRSASQYNIVQSAEGEELTTAWLQLSQLLLALIIAFNRRRSGGVSKMKVTEYELISKTGINDAIETSLSKFERKLARSFYRLEITAKRGNIVPILLTEDMKKHLDALVKHRPRVVPDGNQYMFPRINYGSQSHQKGSECLRTFANECGAQRPDTLCSTTLRKHIATMSQVLNLKDNELDILARFMGHDIRVHREYYRLPEKTLQVAKISKLLLRMEKGGYGLTAGQSLDSVELEDGELAEGNFIRHQFLLAFDTCYLLTISFTWLNACISITSRRNCFSTFYTNVIHCLSL